MPPNNVAEEEELAAINQTTAVLNRFTKGMPYQQRHALPILTRIHTDYSKLADVTPVFELGTLENIYTKPPENPKGGDVYLMFHPAIKAWFNRCDNHIWKNDGTYLLPRKETRAVLKKSRFYVRVKDPNYEPPQFNYFKRDEFRSLNPNHCVCMVHYKGDKKVSVRKKHGNAKKSGAPDFVRNAPAVTDKVLQQSSQDGGKGPKHMYVKLITTESEHDGIEAIEKPRNKQQDNSQISQVLQQLNDVGKIFNAPDVFSMPLIDPPADYEKANYDRYYNPDGFHFGDIIGYMNNIRSLDNCLRACLAHKTCVAVNFISNVNLCILTKTADRETSHLWKDIRIKSVHGYFADGPNAGIGEFLPKNNGVGKLMNPGVTPLLQKRLSQPHTFPWMVRVNDLCNGVLITGSDSRGSKERRKDSDLIIVPYSCIHRRNAFVTLDVRLGSFNDEVVEATEVNAEIEKLIVYDLNGSWNESRVDLVLLLLKKPVAFNDYIRPIAFPQNDKVPNIKKCRVVGWMDKQNKVGILNSKQSSNLTVQIVKSVSYDNDCNGQYRGREFKQNRKLCVQTNSKTCHGQLGGALICYSGSKSSNVIWSLYGYQTTGSRCPQAPFIYTDVASLQSWLRTVAENIDTFRRSDSFVQRVSVVSRPEKLNLNDQYVKIISDAGQDYSYPKPFIMKPIESDIFLRNGLNRVSHRFTEGFHFSDIIGYGLADDRSTCVAGCLALNGCYSANFVSNNSWCVLLASSHMYPENVGLWYDKRVDSTYAYFVEGPKAKAPEHIPRADGQGKRMPAGTPARYGVSRSRIITGREAERFKYSWLVRLPGCGGSLINDDLSNNDRKIASNLLLTAAHCVESEKTNSIKNSTIAKLATYRDDMIEDVEYIVPVTKIIMHKDYDPKRLINDIALLELKLPVKFNDYIGPVALPILNQVPSQPKKCKAIGWGEYRYNKTKEMAQSGKILKEINVEVLSAGDCNQHYYGGRADTFYKNHQLCATSYDQENRFVGTCFGDSGGPMFCPEIINGRKVDVIFGVTSFSTSNCTEKPAGFANVSALMGWLSRAAIQIKQQPVGSVEHF